MTQQTSVQAYVEARQTGLLGEVQETVLRTLKEHGPMTQGETAKFLNMDRNVASPRFAELARFGLIQTSGTRPCRITNRQCLVWDIKERVVAPFVRVKRSDRIKELEAQVEQLTSELRLARAARHG